MPKNNVLEKLREKRKAFEALPLKERLKKNRETRLANLVSTGYITSEEAKQYEKPLTELPQDRKGLVVAYFLSAIENLKDTTPTMGETEDVKRIIRSLPDRAHSSLMRGGSMADGLTREEEEETAERITSIWLNGSISRAERFVDSKRRRIRKQLLNMLTYDICRSLLQKEKEIEPIPYLKDFLKENGYRERAKSLNEEEEEAIRKAATYYLDLLELSFLNGEGFIRRERYESLQDEEGGFKETYYYKDVIDEALLEFEEIYSILEIALIDFYDGETAKEAIDFLKELFSKARAEITEVEEQIQSSKFKKLF